MLPHKLKIGILSRSLFFYFGKNADFCFRVFERIPKVCVVANRGYAFFVCVASVAHTFLFWRQAKMKHKNISSSTLEESKKFRLLKNRQGLTFAFGQEFC